MRLRTQLTLVVTAVVALVVALAGLLIVLRIDHRDRSDLDELLALRAAQVKTEATRSGSLPTDGSYAVRLLQGDQVAKQVGATESFPAPAQDGYSTVAVAESDWRTFTETLTTGARMQILISLQDLEEQHDDNVLVVNLLVLFAALLTAAGVWFATGLVLRPFQRLLTAARALDPANPEARLPEVTSPREVAELTGTLNGMLARFRAKAATASPSEAPSPTAAAVLSPTVQLPVTTPSTAPAATKPTSTPHGPGQAQPGGSRPGQSQPGESRLGQRQSDQSQPGQAQSGQSQPGQSQSGESRPGQGQAPQSQPPAAGPRHAQPAEAEVKPAEPAAAPPPAALPAAASPAAEPAPAQPAPAQPAPIDPGPVLSPPLADLGANLDMLLDNPDLPPGQRHLILAAMAEDHRQMVALLADLRRD